MQLVYQNMQFIDGTIGAVPGPLIQASGSIPVSMFIIQSDLANAAGSSLSIGVDRQISALRGIQMAPGRGIVFSAVEEQLENALVGILQCERMRPRVVLDLTDYYVVGSAAGIVWHCAYMLYDTT